MNLKKLINIFGDLIISITKICMTMIYASMPPFVIQKNYPKMYFVLTS